MKALITVLLVVLGSVSCSGQKGELNRDAAEAIVRKNMKPEEVTFGIPSFVMSSEQFSPQQKAATLFTINKFYGNLIANDWIKEEPCHMSPMIGRGMNPTFHCYTSKNKDARYVNYQERGTSLEQNLQLILFRKTLNRIISIRQEGTKAIARVELKSEMTDSYKNVFRIMGDLTKQCRCVLNFWPESTPPNETRDFYFTKWDDGWHLENTG
jgi:hypothetical protein